MRWVIVVAVAALTAFVTTSSLLELSAAGQRQKPHDAFEWQDSEPVDIERRVLQLPEDGDIWHTSLFLHHGWQSIDQDRQLAAWFETEPKLASLKAQTKWHLYTDDDPIYLDRFRETVPVLPAVVVQRSSGEVIYKASGAHLPSRPGPLANDITATINRKCPGPWCRPVPQPVPKPPEPVVPEPDQTVVIPDTTPPAESNDGQWLLAIAIAGIALTAGVAYQWNASSN